MSFVFRENRYVNMGKAAAHLGRFFLDFTRSSETKEYIEALSVVLRDKEPMIIKRGSVMHATTGSWAHPKLAAFFARWLDVKFVV